MAADILIYDSNVVPVGRDQKQHVEVTRDIAIKFNEAYGQTFIVPEPRIRDETAVGARLDGQKMSKSYGNTIEIFGEEKALRKKVMGLVMDSRTPQEPKPDAEKTSPSSCSNWSRRRQRPRITRTDCAPAAWAMAI
jgi:tryptophanyl-tRNA synthetase